MEKLFTYLEEIFFLNLGFVLRHNNMNNTDKALIGNIFRQKYPEEIIDLTDDSDVDIWRTIQHQELILSDPKPDTFYWTTYQEFEEEKVSDRFQNLFCEATRWFGNYRQTSNKRNTKPFLGFMKTRYEEEWKSCGAKIVWNSSQKDGYPSKEKYFMPSQKFAAFSAGPRTCLGKEMALNEFKMVAAAVLEKYHVEMVKGQTIMPTTCSLILYMEHGLKVRLSKR